MLLGTRPKLQELLIKHLLEMGACSVAHLREYLLANGHQFSKQAVYAELASLMSQSVVIKRGESFDIRLAWLLELRRLANKRTKLVSEDTADTYCELYRARSLIELHQMWSSLGLEILMRSPGEPYFEWVPHCWFPFADMHSENQVVAELKELGIPYHMIVGHDTFLDREAVKLYSDVPRKILFAEAPVEKLKDYCLSVIGSYIITIQIQADFWTTYTELATPIKSWTDPGVETLRELMHSSTKIQVRFEKNKGKATQMRELFRTMFSDVSKAA